MIDKSDKIYGLILDHCKNFENCPRLGGHTYCYLLDICQSMSREKSDFLFHIQNLYEDAHLRLQNEGQCKLEVGNE